MIESYSQIFQNLKKDIYSNVYLLMGEETFYIDKISNHIEDNFIDENLFLYNLKFHSLLTYIVLTTILGILP